MKKRNLLLVVLILFSLELSSSAAITYTKPQPKPTQTTNVQKTPAAPTITKKQKEKYYLDYIGYLKKIILDTCEYTPEQLAKYPLSFRLTFDSNYNLKDVEASGAVGYYQISRDKLKLYNVKFKPYDKAYLLNSPRMNGDSVYVVHFASFYKAFMYKFYDLLVDHSGDLDKVWEVPENSINLKGSAHLKYKLNNFYAYVDGNCEQEWKLVSAEIIKSSGDELFDTSFIIGTRKMKNISLRIPRNSDTVEFDIDFYVEKAKEDEHTDYGDMAPSLNFTKFY